MVGQGIEGEGEIRCGKHHKVEIAQQKQDFCRY